MVVSFITISLLTFGCMRQHNNVLWLTPSYVVRRQLGCTLFKGAHCTPVFSSSQLQANSNHESRGYLRCFAVVGVKAFRGSYELACKARSKMPGCSGHSFLLLFRGRRQGQVGGHYCATAEVPSEFMVRIGLQLRRREHWSAMGTLE